MSLPEQQRQSLQADQILLAAADADEGEQLISNLTFADMGLMLDSDIPTDTVEIIYALKQLGIDVKASSLKQQLTNGNNEEFEDTDPLTRDRFRVFFRRNLQAVVDKSDK